jgi:ABC-type multidrug transport system fused ATPase/permease subunit
MQSNSDKAMSPWLAYSRTCVSGLNAVSILAHSQVPISAFVVGFTFLLAFNTNFRLVLLLWLEIFGTRLLLWFPTVSVNHYVEDLQKTLKEMQDKKSENAEANYNTKRIVKAEREEARSTQKQEKIKQASERTQGTHTNGNNGVQNPVANRPSVSTSGLLSVGASPAPLSDVHEDEILTPNGSANPGSSKRAKVADPEIPRRGST